MIPVTILESLPSVIPSALSDDNSSQLLMIRAAVGENHPNVTFGGIMVGGVPKFATSLSNSYAIWDSSIGGVIPDGIYVCEIDAGVLKWTGNVTVSGNTVNPSEVQVT